MTSQKRSTHFKLGVLALATLAAIAIAALALGLTALRRPKASYHTYFDESVQGLGLGSPVKFRGVAIGTVSAIDIAPDDRHVHVTLALDTRSAGAFDVRPGMRTQLASMGITGVKLVEIDLVDPELHPPPALDFEPPAAYIPSRPSLMKDLEGHLQAVAPQARALVEQAVATFGKIDQMIDEARARRVVERVAAAVGRFERIAAGLERAELGPRVAETIDKIARVADRIGGDGGVAASAQRAIDSIAGISDGLGTSELEQTIHDLGEAARAVRDLAEAIERQPDMLLKGRARTSKR